MAENSQQSTRKFECPIPEDAREHMRTARNEMRQSIKSLLPPSFLQHRHQARKEMLLAWRSMIDAAINHIESKEPKAS